MVVVLLEELELVVVDWVLEVEPVLLVVVDVLILDDVVVLEYVLDVELEALVDVVLDSVEEVVVVLELLDEEVELLDVVESVELVL